MSALHPTASIDDRARIAEGVAIGPNCIVQGPVTIGAGTKLIAGVYLNGPLTLGQRNTLYPGVCVGFAPQSRRYEPTEPGAGVTIGDDNVLRESVTIHRASGDVPTQIGDQNYFMVNSHVGHDGRLGNGITISNAVEIAGHVEIQDGVTMGGRSGVHQFCRIGRLAMLGGVAVVTQDVPPFCTVYISRRVGALNVIGLRRAGLEQHIKPLNRAFELLYESRLPTSKAVAAIYHELSHDPLCVEMADFVAASKRGISPGVGSRRSKQETDS